MSRRRSPLVGAPAALLCAGATVVMLRMLLLGVVVGALACSHATQIPLHVALASTLTKADTTSIVQFHLNTSDGETYDAFLPPPSASWGWPDQPAYDYKYCSFATGGEHIVFKLTGLDASGHAVAQGQGESWASDDPPQANVTLSPTGPPP